jgi:DNA mismatch endonuclease, patch repair protein
MEPDNTGKKEDSLLITNKRSCQCGCSEIIDAFDKRGRPRSYKFGHSTRGRIPWNLAKETSVDTRRKISKTLTGTHRPEAVRIKISKGNLGKKKSELARLHLSQAIKGKKRRPHSEETKRKISEKQKGRKDKPLSEKHKQSISYKLKGIVRPEETRQKMSQAGFLRTHTEETRHKLSLIRVKQIFPRKDSTTEVRLQEILTKNNIHYTKHEPLTGQPDIFILPNICIFVDGRFWHADPRYYKPNDITIGGLVAVKRWEKDGKITLDLISSGYIVLRFWEDDIKTNLERCFKAIKERIN